MYRILPSVTRLWGRRLGHLLTCSCLSRTEVCSWSHSSHENPDSKCMPQERRPPQRQRKPRAGREQAPRLFLRWALKQAHGIVHDNTAWNQRCVTLRSSPSRNVRVLCWGQWWGHWLSHWAIFEVLDCLPVVFFVQ